MNNDKYIVKDMPFNQWLKYLKTWLPVKIYLGPQENAPTEYIFIKKFTNEL